MLRNTLLSDIRVVGTSGLCWFVLGSALHAVDPKQGPKLPFDEDLKPLAKEIQKLAHDEMGQVTSIAVSPNGKHAYAAAFGSDTVSILDRDPGSGQLKFRKSLTAPHYGCMVAFRLSKDGTLGAGSAFRSQSIVLFRRNPETGELKELDHFGGNQRPIAELNFCIDNAISPDNRFVYTIGSHAIVAFEVEEDQLVHVESYTEPNPGGPARLMSNGRGVWISPDGKWLYATWQGSGSMMVYSRNAQSGKLTLRQTLRDGVDGIKGLGGVMHCTASPDGNFVYTASGRFGGANGVCTFSVKADGTLAQLQALTGDDLSEGFGGGNEIAVSPSGNQVAVACTTADKLARFARNPLTGRLTAIDCMPAGEDVAPGSAGVTFGPKGRFILVADENSNSIVVFHNQLW